MTSWFKVSHMLLHSGPEFHPYYVQIQVYVPKLLWHLLQFKILPSTWLLAPMPGGHRSFAMCDNSIGYCSPSRMPEMALGTYIWAMDLSIRRLLFCKIRSSPEKISFSPLSTKDSYFRCWDICGRPLDVIKWIPNQVSDFLGRCISKTLEIPTFSKVVVHSSFLWSMIQSLHRCFWHRIKNEWKSCWICSWVILMLLPSFCHSTIMECKLLLWYKEPGIFFFYIVKSLVLIFEMCCLHNNIFPQVFPHYL